MHLHGALRQGELYQRAYPELDVLLLFSPAEGSPNAVYEAMQHGVVPVVARYLGLRPEGIVRDGETGLVFPVGDIDAAAEHISRLALDAGAHELLSRAAAAEVASDTSERMHRDWERILEATIARARRPLSEGLFRPLPVSGRLDRIFRPFTAALIRRASGRGQRFADGWGEWPGTAAASPQCVVLVRRRMAEIDALS